jgi:hypothetical protein
MAIVWLGNTAVREVVGADEDGAPIHRRYSGQAACTVTIDDSYTLDEAVRTIVHADGHWPRHSSKAAAWVESDNEELAKALADHFGCPVGRPSDWKDEVTLNG